MSIKKHIELIESITKNTTKETVNEGREVDLFLKASSAEEAANSLIAEAKDRADMYHKEHEKEYGEKYPQDHVGEHSRLIGGVGRVRVKAIKVPTLENGVAKKYQYRITIKVWQQRVPKKELIRRFELAKEQSI